MLRPALTLTLLCGVAAPAFAVWPAVGRSLCNGCTASYFHTLASDGAGGAYVLWTDLRGYATTDYDVYMQRVLATGEIAPGWPLAGLPLCDTTFTQRGIDIIPDGAGGAIAMWADNRAQLDPATNTHRDIFAQRILPDCSIAPGWLPQGSPVTRARLTQQSLEWPSMTSDGAGGALFIWEDERDYLSGLKLDVYLQRMTASGEVAPGWPLNGRAVSALPEFQMFTLIASDGASGAFTAWQDYRDLPGQYELFQPGQAFGARVLGDGSDAPGWTPGGQLLHPARGRPDALVADGAGGVYVVFAIPTADAQSDSFYVAQRQTAAGVPALGWPAGGVILCDAPGIRHLGPSVSDDMGGLLTSWAGAPGAEIYVTRLRSDGSRPPGWPENGLMVSSTEPNPYGEFDPTIAADGLGGCYVAWERQSASGQRCVIQHVTSQGIVAAGWPAGGLQVQSAHLSASNPVIIADGVGGAILAYASPTGTPFVQRFGQDGVVAAAVSLVRAEAQSHQIRLHWYASEVLGFTAALERRTTAAEPWQELTQLAADGSGSMKYVDRDVVPGQRYAYRLRWSEHSAVRTTTEAWVETPALLQFALHGLQPNPSTGAAVAAFTLPGRASGELELLDVSGRRVLSREVGTLGPGRHVVRLSERELVPPGLYMLRLRWGEQSATARGVVIR